MPIWGGNSGGGVMPFEALMWPVWGRSAGGAVFTPSGGVADALNLPPNGPVQNYSQTAPCTSNSINSEGVYSATLLTGQTGNVLQVDVPAEVQVFDGTPIYTRKDMSLRVGWNSWDSLAGDLCPVISPDPATFDVAEGFFEPTVYTATFDISAVPAQSTIYLVITFNLTEGGGGTFAAAQWVGRMRVIS